MSRSNPTLTNPAQHFLTWKDGRLSWYSKERDARVPVKFPFEFMVIDQLATITGYSKRDKSGYWSNEVRNVTKEEFIVRTKHGIAQSGLYKELADIRAKGAKYAKSIYIVHKVGEGYIIGNIKASGSALTAWIEFSDTCKVEHGKIRLTGAKQETGELGDYFSPVFEWDHTTPEEDQIAIDMDSELQAYLRQYFIAAAIDRENMVEEGGIDSNLGKATPEQIADYEQKRKAGKRQPTAHEQVETAKAADEDEWEEKKSTKKTDKAVTANGPDPEYPEDEPISFEDIPF
jgi:hypothetical protein